jgi:predicted nucleotidyltransferase
MFNCPTPYPEVNEVLNLLLENAKTILKDQFVGMYLYGSLSSGDFNPKTSDVDFLVITTDILSNDLITKLEAMHKDLWASGTKWTDKLEGAYIPQQFIRRHDPNHPVSPMINEGTFALERDGSDWIIQRHIIREMGVVVEGPDPKSLIDPVSPDEIRSAIRGVLNEWWFPMLDDPSWLRAHEGNYLGFAVVTMCRAFHAIEHGTIVSKPKAVAWAKNKFGEQWHPLIEKAIASQCGKNPDFLDETLSLIRYTQEQVEESK